MSKCTRYREQVLEHVMLQRGTEPHNYKDWYIQHSGPHLSSLSFHFIRISPLIEQLPVPLVIHLPFAPLPSHPRSSPNSASVDALRLAMSDCFVVERSLAYRR